MAHKEKTDYLVALEGADKLSQTLRTLEQTQRDRIGGVKIPTTLSKNLKTHDWRRLQQLCAQNGTFAYLGGGMMETAIEQGTPYRLTQALHSAGIDAVEISKPKGIDQRKFLEIAQEIRKDFNTMLIEIGEKTHTPYPLHWWMRHAFNAEEVGADAIVLEGAGSGTVGIYDPYETPHPGLVESLHDIFDETTQVIVEAPLMHQQEHWIHTLGPNVSMGNLLAHPTLIKNIDIVRECEERRRRVVSATKIA